MYAVRVGATSQLVLAAQARRREGSMAAGRLPEQALAVLAEPRRPALVFRVLRALLVAPVLRELRQFQALRRIWAPAPD